MLRCSTGYSRVLVAMLERTEQWFKLSAIQGKLDSSLMLAEIRQVLSTMIPYVDNGLEKLWVLLGPLLSRLHLPRSQNPKSVFVFWGTMTALLCK